MVSRLVCPVGRGAALRVAPPHPALPRRPLLVGDARQAARRRVAVAAASGDSGKGKRGNGDKEGGEGGGGGEEPSGDNLFKMSIDEFVGGPEGLDAIASGTDDMAKARAQQPDDDIWMDWGVGKEDWDGRRKGNRSVKGAPKRPRYPGFVPNAKKNNVWRDDWIRPMSDAESLRQRLFMAEEDAARLQEQEALANSFESQQAIKFAGILIGVPIVTALAARIFVINPVLTYILANPGSFTLSYMQEVEGAHEVHQEETRMKMEVAMGRAPPLTEDEMAAHLRHHALEVLEETREHNMNGLGNLCQDSLMGVLGLTILIVSEEGRPRLFRASERFVSGVSDQGKAFVIILVADTLMGYHSEEGWTALIRVLAEHWNMEPEQNNVYLFVASFPVLLDALFKLWLFQGFVRTNPAASVTLKAMDRH